MMYHEAGKPRVAVADPGYAEVLRSWLALALA
jgi:hypothetical protein